MPKISFISPTGVLIDGLPAGPLADVLRTRPELAEPISSALGEYHAQQQSELRARDLARAERRYAARLRKAKEAPAV